MKLKDILKSTASEHVEDLLARIGVEPKSDPIVGALTRRTTLRQSFHKYDAGEHGFVISSYNADNRAAKDAMTKLAAEVGKELIKMPIRMEKPTASRLDEFLDIFLKTTYGIGAQVAELRKAMYDVDWIPHSIAVEHDWLALVKDSDDFARGEWRLPYDVTGFEFRLNGVHLVVVACVPTDEGTPKSFRFGYRLGGKHGWAIDDRFYDLTETGWRPSHPIRSAIGPFIDFLYKQIKACSIVLDAKVAVVEPIRVPHKSNEPRKPWEPPDKPRVSFHVLKLAHRHTRAPPLPSSGDIDGPPHHRNRLHFRRGHWRHYENHKTWIRWMLCGDPDLGFVEKDYKL